MISYGIPVRVDPILVKLPVASDRTPPVTLRVYRDGVLLDTVATASGSAELLLAVAAGTAPKFEVLDSDCRPRPAHPGVFDLHWLGVAGAQAYRVEEQIDGEWVERVTIADNGNGAYVWKTRWLEDAAMHHFRVTAIDAGGNLATAATMSALMVRCPDPPSVTIAKSDNALTLDIS